MSTAALCLDTEDALQKHLDAHPDDHTARLVLADLLDERGDERAAGYRALGRLMLHPTTYNCTDTPGVNFYWCNRGSEHFVLPVCWFASLPHVPRLYTMSEWPAAEPNTRKSVEDAAAIAYRPEFEDTPT